MFYDISTLAVGLIAAFALGAAVGWRRGLVGGARVATLVFVIGITITALLWPPMRGGSFLEAALSMFAVYVIGCVAGAALHKVFAPPAAPALPAAGTKGPELAPVPAADPGRSAEPVSSAEPTPANEANEAELAPTAPADPPRAAEAKGSEIASAPAPASDPAPAAESAAAPEPALIHWVEGEEKHGGARPVGYVSPLGGVPDDLRRIKGIGPQNEARLHALGVWRYSQIASWSRANVQWVGGYLSFSGRVDRERWVEQATKLAAELDVGKRAQRADGSEGDGEIANLRRLSGVSEARLKRR